MRKLTLQSRQTAIFLMGPTASGKTSLALALRNRLPVEIVSVDSALIYSGMDIGTAKPSAEDLVQAPHRLIDIRDPADDYSAADFIRNALDEMEDIITAGSIPLLVGGTMLYFKVLLDGLSQLPNADNSLRTHIYRKAETMGLAYLHRQLQNIDPISANRIHPNDLHRLERALEVFFVEGNTITELTKISGEAIVYRVYQFSIAPLDRALLHQRVERRFYNMLEAGFENEVRKLFSRGDIHRDMQSIRCVGYRNMWSYLEDEMSYDEMVFSVICATRQLAKRQMTWLRSWPEVNWLDSEQPRAAFDSILKIVSA